MLIQLHHILDRDRLQNLREFLAGGQFVDGVLSAGDNARRVKHNEELSPDLKQREYLDQMVMSRLAKNEDFRSAALPLRVSQPVFARYTRGMEYGDHIDDPVMGDGGGRFRVDIAVTLFLSEPDSYQGGELTINTAFGEQSVKLAAGDAVLYPASSQHRVNPVSDGERLVCVLWIQSMIRDPAQRQLLFDLNQVRESLRRDRPGSDEAKRSDHVYTNLVRMWSEV